MIKKTSLKKAETPVDIISVTHGIRELTNGKEMPIYAIRIIFYLINQLRQNQFQEKRAKQLKMVFDEEFLTENNTYEEFTIKFKDIAVNSKNNKLIKEAIEYLYKYKEGWYESKNSEGKVIKSYGGFISNPNYENKTGINFTISSYWLNEMLNLDLGYNPTLYKIAFILSSTQQIKFYLWLNTIVNFRDIKLDTLNEIFHLNYNTTKDISKDFLAPVKKVFDKVSDISFNFSRKGDIIKIVKYDTKTLLKDTTITEKTKTKLATKYTLSYLKRKYKIKDENCIFIKEILSQNNFNTILLEEAYKLFITTTRKKKEKATKYQDIEFLKAIQQCIIHVYKRKSSFKISPNGYPKVIE